MGLEARQKRKEYIRFFLDLTQSKTQNRNLAQPNPKAIRFQNITTQALIPTSVKSQKYNLGLIDIKFHSLSTHY